MKITQLNIYPVKSLGGIRLDEAVLTAEELAWKSPQWLRQTSSIPESMPAA
ncbi:MOSC N-terminal beta barrel domain-containing protein [Halomonas campisalis]|uniref:MOSC N-terminal beta barrel domain-containing protein n=1 Tax=Billgrantia campisalis TaxID=74661 RepID=UPI001EF0D00A|nr:MOSC N-terminal beta barrel domain-containing protein [Halomonas campisalis]MDR5863906.1 MOSC N-terminal beta barrel domain-containing protein [Halomonas campisalis]